jgi:hypothetical protein
LPAGLKRATAIAYPDGDLIDDHAEESLAALNEALKDLRLDLPAWVLLPILLAFGLGLVLLILTCLFCLASALLCRGGFLWHAFSIDAVTSDGRLAPRWRLVCRQLLIWLPLLVFVGSSFTPFTGEEWFDSACTAAVIIWFVIMAISVFLKRSILERLTGIWLIIR